MSQYTVMRDDLRNAARSYTVGGVIGVLALLVVLIFVVERNTFADPYRTLFDVELLVAFVLPLFLAPVAYLCIAGERADGTITFSMGLPNSRGEFLAGKFLSRLVVAVAAVVLALGLGLVVAATTFANAPDVGRFLLFGGVSLLYALAWVGIFVAISASTRKRSRAMVGVFVAYFVLTPFWFGLLGPLSIQTLVDTAADLLGVTLTDTTRRYITSFSPSFAYVMAAKPVYAGVMDQYSMIQGNYAGSSDALPTRAWYNALVMLAWSAVALAIGYLRFRTSELR